MRILIVEDEVELCDAIAEGLQLDGYAVDCCYDGEEALELLLVEVFDLVVLDLNLPNMDGIYILTELRKTNNDIKVLILSARDTMADKVLGLDLGANDYLVKPFGFEELEARVRGLLRRTFVQANSTLTFAEISLDTAKRTVVVGNTELSLTKKELGILEYLLLHQSKVVSQEELIEHVWSVMSDNFSNAVRVHIASLRKKLKLALGYDIIATKISEGYYLTKATEAER